MYQNSSYEDYMSYLLGYESEKPQKTTEEAITYEAIQDVQMIEFYPEIYKIVYPMVCKICMNTKEEITKDLLEKMTNEIYEAIETEEVEEVQTLRPLRTMTNMNQYQKEKNQNSYYQKQLVKQETRHRNFLLHDLIKILLLRELIGGGRDPKPPVPPRPPMPPRPPRPEEIIPPPMPPRPPKF